MNIDFDNTYAQLPERFFERVDPQPVDDPQTVRANDTLAERLGFDPDWLRSDDGAAFATGNRLLEGAEPIAMAYAGHQFGSWVPQLGDGRAILLGEVVAADDSDGQDSDGRFDIQLKGSGRTPYSRRGDGRAPLGPVLREYLVSEAMAALGVPTTRALAAATTGETVRRETRQPGGVIVRVARSHIRIGTFQYFAGRGDREALETLTDYVINRHYPDIPDDSPVELFRRVAARQAELVAQWQLLGFIHGVMNTDNMLLSGETIDYGPCAFMNTYDPQTVYSSIDRYGRYAYGNQPKIAQWNLGRLAEALVKVVDDDARPELRDALDAVIQDFPDTFRAAYRRGLALKLGFSEFLGQGDGGEESDRGDWTLMEDLLDLMYRHELDYTLTFRRLTELAAPEDRGPAHGPLLDLPDAFAPWLERWRGRLDDDPAPREEQHRRMAARNPVFIPRNHRVNAAIDAAVQNGDLSAFHAMVDLLEAPYEYRASKHEYAMPPTPDEEIAATFCGT